MGSIFVYSDSRNLAAELVSFAKGSGRRAIALTFNEQSAHALADSGADKVCILNGDSPLPENYGRAIADLLTNENAELFAVGATTVGRDVAARVAGCLDCGMVSDVSRLAYVEGKLSTERMMYGGAVQQTVELEELAVVKMRPGTFETISGSDESVTLNSQADARVSLVLTALIVIWSADLSASERVMCVGMALNKQEDLQIAKDLAAVVGAEIGCTRAVAEERHWLPVEQYIGISGATVKPKLYLAMGVSGQIQHVFGIRDSQIIVAVNTDEKAPIFKAADCGIVGDMYEVIPLLTNALKRA